MPRNCCVSPNDPTARLDATIRFTCPVCGLHPVTCCGCDTLRLHTNPCGHLVTFTARGIAADEGARRRPTLDELVETGRVLVDVTTGPDGGEDRHYRVRTTGLATSRTAGGRDA